ncbi:DNA-binding GntR family transcriptional regulator [Acidovorax soli]|uniref:DNA-binding GntR family transcriptional regulator n=1 Tax=Acidovorax soli TaxID=592050 RepID=A0A7X0PCR9_9BURK|nr:GntR family transcriptional regulator [Acidovorax soli]MBB6559436.1 DNA-binding GntR family transcriptional regulator [Acidovorax soli]
MPAATIPRKTATAKAVPAATLDQPVYEAVLDAVMHGQLRPGERLGEPALCERFGVSRTVVRQALHRLAELRILDIVPNKGATVARPGPKETREIFAARRVVEAGIVRMVAARITHGEVQRLTQRLRAEHEALHQQDHARWVALAGGFHLALAELSGNAELQRILSDLMTRCSLIVALYEAPGEASCEHAEHEQLVEWLALRDGEAAAGAMERHLLALEARLRLPAEEVPVAS